MTEEMRGQLIELTRVHKGLRKILEQNDETVVSGPLPFEASANGLETITESFELALAIPHEFPNRLPKVIETGGRIRGNYAHINSGGTLCLAVPVEQRRIFFEQPTLLGFVNRLVIPYLYGFSFWEKYGWHPFDEAAHGCEGILRHYIDTLKLRDEAAALAVISFLFEYGYRGHHNCPCGSNLNVRKCHGPALFALHQYHTPQTLRIDFLAIFEICFAKFQDGQLSLSTPLRSQVVRLLDTIKAKKGGAKS